MASKSAPNKLLNKSQLAALLEVTLPTINNWLAKGAPYAHKPENGGQWELSVPDIVNWLITRAEGRFDSKDLTAERTRETRLRADLLQCRLDLEEGRMLPTDMIEMQWSFLISNARAVLLSLPSRCAIQVAGMTPAEAEELLRQSVYESLNKLSEVDVYPDDYQPEDMPGLDDVVKLQ